MNLINIKNIIFDLGGVILNIDYQETIQAFQNLGASNFYEVYNTMSQTETFDLFEKGLINEDEFRSKIRKNLPNASSDEQIDAAWNAMLLDLPTERIKLLEKLKKQYRTFLLSNTNIIHMRAYTKTLHDQYGYKSLADLFEKEYFSHVVKMRKPDLEIYKHVLKENNLKAEETIFLDDSAINLEGAAKVGINTILVANENDINLIFKDI